MAARWQRKPGDYPCGTPAVSYPCVRLSRPVRFGVVAEDGVLHVGTIQIRAGLDERRQLASALPK